MSSELRPRERRVVRSRPVVGRRCLAALADIVVLFVAFVCVGVASGQAYLDDAYLDIHLHGDAAVVWLAIVFVYYFLTEALTAQTLGKLMFGLRVARIDGSDPTPGAILARTLLRVIDVLPILYLLGLLVMLVSRDEQRIGDLVADTVVIDARA